MTIVGGADAHRNTHVWRAQDLDLPCRLTGREWPETDGQVFVEITREGSVTSVPKDEIITFAAWKKEQSKATQKTHGPRAKTAPRPKAKTESKPEPKPSAPEWVLAYARAGLRVFPVKIESDPETGDTEKKPHIMKWPERATTDEALLGRWWRKWPDAEAGWAVPAEVVVTDLDEKDDKHGIAEFELRMGVGVDAVETPQWRQAPRLRRQWTALQELGRQGRPGDRSEDRGRPDRPAIADQRPRLDQASHHAASRRSGLAADRRRPTRSLGRGASLHRLQQPRSAETAGGGEQRDRAGPERRAGGDAPPQVLHDRRPRRRRAPG